MIKKSKEVFVAMQIGDTTGVEIPVLYIQNYAKYLVVLQVPYNHTYTHQVLFYYLYRYMVLYVQKDPKIGPSSVLVVPVPGIATGISL